MTSRAIPWLKVGLMAASAAGCEARLPDVPGAADRATGMHTGIVFHHRGEAIEQAPFTGDHLDVERVVTATLAHDARIQVALAKVRIAEADANQARLLPNPVLGVDVRYPRGNGTNTVFEATISEDLIGILQKPAQVRAADSRLRAAAADALAVVLDVLTEAQGTFASALELEVEITSAEKRLEALKRTRVISELRLKEGEISRLDVSILDAQLEQSSLDLADLRLRRDEVRLMLARLMGEPGSTMRWRLTAREEPEWEGSSDEAWVRAGLLHRPELASKIWELRALGDDVTLAALSPLQGTAVGGHVERDPQWRFGPTLSVPLPIFDWGQVARARAETLRTVARHELVQLAREAVREIRLAYVTCDETSRELVAARGRLLPMQQVHLDQARLAYREGESDLVTSLLAENEFRLAEVRVAQLADRATQARLRLERAVGGAAFVVTGPATEPGGSER